MGVGADAPDVEVADGGAFGFGQRADLGRQRGFGGVEQDGGGVLHQAPGPARDDDRPQYADRRVEPPPAEIAPGEQRRDRQHRCQRVGQHMDIGGAQIIVGMAMLVPVIMIMPVSMIMAMVVAQQKRADDVDDEADDRHQRRFTERDLHRLQEAHPRFDRDEQRHDAQQQRRRKARQVADLARAEGEARIARMPPGIAIGSRRYSERARMGRHVKTIGQQRHRAGHPARDDLHHHGRGGQPHDPQRPPGIFIMPVRQIDMVEIMAVLAIHAGGRWRVVVMGVVVMGVAVPGAVRVIVVHRHFP